MDVNDSSVLYERVAQAERRWGILNRIKSQHQSLSLESGASSSVELKIQKIDSDAEVLILDGVFPSSDEERLTVRFMDGENRGFFRCRSLWKDGSVQLLIKGEELFLEQKRQDFRLVIPESYPALFEVTMRSQGILPVQARVLDLNIKGVSLDVDAKESFQVGELLEGDLRLGQRPSVHLAGEVRFQKARPEEGRSQVGLRFQHIQWASEASLMELIAFFHSDLFQLRKSNDII